jgi:hypothetical protein
MSAVIGQVLACPRTPSVPKNRLAMPDLLKVVE